MYFVFKNVCSCREAAKWKERSLQIRKIGSSNPEWVKSMTEKLAPAAFQVSVHHLRPREKLVSPLSV